MSIGYRKDIDGLRAVAIVPVVLYHAGLSVLGGGFIGVDVFFVISGYLITSILADEIGRGDVSILGFYERRARRIFPALFVMLLVSIVVSAAILLPFDLRAFSRSVIATVSFTSNILFHLESGYFAAPSELKPLLHTWSLAVEEQFYILFPILLVLLSRTGRRTRNAALVAIAALSFAVNLWGVRPHPSATFYLLPARAWELLLGSLLALNILPVPAGRGLREIAAALGLALIGTGMLTLSAADPFPGWNATLPCIGAALIIWAGIGGDSLGGRLLGLQPLVFVGRISYSLYLWHWPVIVFVKYTTNRALSPAEAGIAVAVSLVAATLSWRFIEQPFRGKNRFTRRGIFTASAMAAALLLSVGAVGYGTKGWPQRFPEALPIIAKYAEYPASFGMLRRDTCFLREDQPAADYDRNACYGGASPDVLIWGDSLAAHLYRGLSAQASRARLTIGQATQSLCAPVLNLPAYYIAGCKAFNDRILGLIRQDPPRTVILAGRWEVVGLDGIARLGDTIAALKSAGSEVIVVGQSPIFPAPAYALYIKALHNDSVAAPVAENDYGPLNRRVAEVAERNGAAFFAPERLFCSGGRCRIQRDGVLLFWDTSHLTEEGSDYVGEKFFDQYGAALISRARAKL
ncbi:acyltransferase family protein [Inquilinus sp.]|jgi:peptidoglycan/LPS O-acetylase OafA/YrhL|uniref:acyltransferase family protein n=1 Tax=Inquilinus sp. TaxID=1932117 RepID=UPI00378464C9